MLDQLLLISMETKSLFDWTTDTAGDATAAVKAVGLVAVLALAAFNIFRNGMSMAKVVAMLFVGGMAWWLIQGNALQFFGQLMQGLSSQK